MITIKTDEMELVYDFDKLNTEQVELARELGEWKLQQMEAPANDFNLVLRSGGAKFLFVFCSYIFLPKKDKKVLPFEFDFCAEIADSLKRCNAKKERPKMKEAVTNFFLNMDEPEIGSTLLQSRLVKQNQDSLLRTLLAVSENTKNLPEEPNPNNEDSTQEKLTEEPKS